MKEYLNFIKIAIVLIVCITLIGLIGKVSSLNKEVSVYDNNFKALNLENDRLNNEIIAYKFDTEQLEYINDSIVKELNIVRKELGIKDKQLKQMQSIKTEIHTIDSVFVRDTLFEDSFIKLDTLLGDDWYKVKLELEYPNKIKLEAKYTSDLSVFAYSSKEIIGTPKKCAIGRWFQKKHKVVRVEVHDKNPHANIKESKFIIVE